MKSKFLTIVVAAVMLITGCGNGEQNGGSTATPITDKMQFAQADKLEGKRFASDSTDSSSFDHYGYVTLRSCKMVTPQTLSKKIT